MYNQEKLLALALIPYVKPQSALIVYVKPQLDLTQIHSNLDHQLTVNNNINNINQSFNFKSIQNSALKIWTQFTSFIKTIILSISNPILSHFKFLIQRLYSRIFTPDFTEK